MAVGTRSSSTVSTPINQQTLGDAIKSALITSGLTLYTDTVNSGSRNLVFSYVVDSTKTYGTTYYRIRIDASMNIWQSAGTAWNSTTAVMTNTTTETQWAAVNANFPVNLTSVNGGSEYSFVVMTNNTTSWTFGMDNPVNRPSWWDLNFWSWGFHWTNGNHITCKSTAQNPYSNDAYNTSLGQTNMASINNQTKQIDIQRGIIFYTQSGQGIAGRTSDDWAMGCFNGIAPLQTNYLPGTNELFLILVGGTGGLALKISS